MSALHIVFPTPGDVIAAGVIVAFWVVLAYFALIGDQDDE